MDRQAMKFNGYETDEVQVIKVHSIKKSIGG